MKEYFNPFGKFFWSRVLSHIPNTLIILGLLSLVGWSLYIYHQGRQAGISSITPEGWVKAQKKVFNKTTVKVPGAKEVVEVTLNPKEVKKSVKQSTPLKITLVRREYDYLGSKPEIESLVVSNATSLFAPRLGVTATNQGIGADFQVIKWQRLTGDLIATQRPFLGVGAGYYFTQSVKGVIGGGMVLDSQVQAPGLFAGLSFMF